MGYYDSNDNYYFKKGYGEIKPSTKPKKDQKKKTLHEQRKELAKLLEQYEEEK